MSRLQNWFESRNGSIGAIRSRSPYEPFISTAPVRALRGSEPVFIPENTIQEVRERTDIVDVISRYVDMRRAGSNFKALCPFHQEKTPSFMVSPGKQIFHCFGCGKGGNVFVFVMEMEGISFPEAVRSLGRSCGVDVAFKKVPDEVRTRNEALFHANEFAARWYHSVLMDQRSGDQTRRYLAARGISEESCRTFMLGCTTTGWDSLFKAAAKKGIPLDDLKELKLVVPRETAGGYYDYFRKRLMFPIVSVSGRVLAFGARTLARGGEPKYLNSIESAVFAKRRTFFGMNHARDAVRAAKKIILVEGYTDCISLHQIGFKNCVASCGTAITTEHASILRRLTQNAMLVPDGDEAGELGAVSTGALLLSAGLEVRIARLEEGGDPDTIAKEKGEGGFSAIIEKSMDYFEFLNYIIKYKAPSLGSKEKLMRRLIDGVAGTADQLHMEMLLQEFARIFSVDFDTIRQQAERMRRYGANAARSKKDSRTPESSHREYLEKITLRLMVEEPSIAEEARQQLDADDFHQKSCRELYKLLDSALEKHIDLKSHEFQHLAGKAGVAGLAAEITLISIPPGDLSVLLRDYIKRIKEFKIRDELKVLSEKLRTLPEESEEAVAVAEYYSRLKIALTQL